MRSPVRFMGLLLLLAASSLGVRAAETAGRVLFVSGEAHVERVGGVMPAEKGLSVAAGDLLVTGRNGRLQLLMNDGERIALRPMTRFSIEEFREPESKDRPQSGRSFYSLLKGGFHSLTASRGLRGDDSYRVRTPVATIGIRGTDYQLRLCADDCEKAGNGNGLYAGVLGGGIVIKNDGGSLNLDKGGFGFVASAASAPVKLKEQPAPLLQEGGGGVDDSLGSDLSVRKSPMPSGGRSPFEGNASTDQQILGKDPQGDTHDLTPGQAPQPQGPIEHEPL